MISALNTCLVVEQKKRKVLKEANLRSKDSERAYLRLILHFTGMKLFSDPNAFAELDCFEILLSHKEVFISALFGGTIRDECTIFCGDVMNEEPTELIVLSFTDCTDC